MPQIFNALCSIMIVIRQHTVKVVEKMKKVLVVLSSVLLLFLGACSNDEVILDEPIEVENLLVNVGMPFSELPSFMNSSLLSTSDESPYFDFVIDANSGVTLLVPHDLDVEPWPSIMDTLSGGTNSARLHLMVERLASDLTAPWNSSRTFIMPNPFNGDLFWVKIQNFQVTYNHFDPRNNVLPDMLDVADLGFLYEWFSMSFADWFGEDALVTPEPRYGQGHHRHPENDNIDIMFRWNYRAIDFPIQFELPANVLFNRDSISINELHQHFGDFHVGNVDGLQHGGFEVGNDFSFTFFLDPVDNINVNRITVHRRFDIMPPNFEVTADDIPSFINVLVADINNRVDADAHPFALALQRLKDDVYFVDIHSFLVDVDGDGTEGMVVSISGLWPVVTHDDFRRGILFYLYNGNLYGKDWGREGQGFNPVLSRVTANDRLAVLMASGGTMARIIFGVDNGDVVNHLHLTTQRHMTDAYGDAKASYYLNGDLITESEFYDLLDRYSLDYVDNIFWGIEDETKDILLMRNH